LVAGERVEVAANVLDIDGEMNRPLRAVDQHRNAALARNTANLLYWNNRSEHVRNVRQRDHLGAGSEQPLELIEQELATVRHRYPLQNSAFAFAQEVPGDDVRVVLHDGEHDL